MTAERISAGAYREKRGSRAGRHRLTVRTTAGTRTGSTALRWIGADRTQQSGAYKRDPAGSGRLGTLCQKEHGKTHQQTARGAGADSTRTPQADKAAMLPLCLKGHGTPARALTEEERATTEERRAGKRPPIEGTGPGKTGQKGSKVLLGPCRDAGRGRRIIFADVDQKNFRISLRIA